MARARLLVLSSIRLARLDALLVASGAPRGQVERVDDAMELFDFGAARGARLLADLDHTPLADAGILRRWQEDTPGSRILWVGGDRDARRAFEAAGVRGEWVAWPLHVEMLERLAGGYDPETQRGPDAAGDPATEASRSPSKDDPNLELHEIESILGQGTADRSTTEFASDDPPIDHPAEGPIIPAAAPPVEGRRPATPDLPNPTLEARSAFLRAPNVQSERPVPVPEAKLRGAHPVLSGAEPLEAHSLESPAPVDEPYEHEGLAGPVSPPKTEPLDEPLLTDEEIEAFFGEAEDFVIPAMDPGGRDAPEAPEDSISGGAQIAGDAQHAPAPESPTPGAPTPGAPADVAALSSPEVEAAEEEASADAAALAARRPAWLKDQIADLADIVQALDLTARANHAHLSLERELGQLRQFTRTIGFVAAPPPRGEQDFDLGVLVEEQLGGLAGQTPDAPRILFKSQMERPLIRADKLLVTMALEALLLTAIGCAGPGDVIRVSIDGRGGDGPGGGGPCVHIRFPAGPMSDLAPTEALQPYALKTRLPDIGANAVAAAGAIAVGQGGDLVLRADGPDSRVFDVSFSDAVSG